MILIPAKGPLDWSGLLAFYRMRAVAGIESVSHDTYRREMANGWTEVTSAAGASEVALRLADSLAPQAAAITARIAHMFDLQADSARIAGHIGFPNAWLPGCWDPFELAVRAVLGQQISVAAARTFAGRLVELCGSGDFPSPAALASADLAGIGLVQRRARTLSLLAQAVHENRMDYSYTALTAIPGIGPWTAHYIGMRALKDSDAFPSSDLVLRKVLSLTEKQLLARAEAWRPYRAYAVIQLWRSAS
ncbi:MAG: transcriptional regulator Ada / DNA-3-methyladenine glycosylase [Bryobacterales bacterium]|nr:transcriptional regulator Ada / DNA-3-methyladenine glycosylase [Bryobacterales bacterium]